MAVRKGESSDYLFCTAYGQQTTVDVIESQIARYNRKRGVEKTSLHMFRHTFAKKWILNGGDIFRLQKILGHSTLDMVKQYVAIYGADLKRDYEQYSLFDRANASLRPEKQSIKMKS